MKYKKYHNVRAIQKSNIKIVERGKIDALATQMHDRSLFWLGTGTSKVAGVKPSFIGSNIIIFVQQLVI